MRVLLVSSATSNAMLPFPTCGFRGGIFTFSRGHLDRNNKHHEVGAAVLIAPLDILQSGRPNKAADPQASTAWWSHTRKAKLRSKIGPANGLGSETCFLL